MSLEVEQPKPTLPLPEPKFDGKTPIADVMRHVRLDELRQKIRDAYHGRWIGSHSSALFQALEALEIIHSILKDQELERVEKKDP